MLELVVDVVSAILVIIGCLLALLAAIGLHRFPDVFTRMHAATKPATLGLLLVVVATALHVDTAGSSVKLLLVIALQFLTTPVGAHMVGRAAYRSGVDMTDRTVIDQLGREQMAERYDA